MSCIFKRRWYAGKDYMLSCDVVPVQCTTFMWRQNQKLGRIRPLGVLDGVMRPVLWQPHAIDPMSCRKHGISGWLQWKLKRSGYILPGIRVYEISEFPHDSHHPPLPRQKKFTSIFCGYLAFPHACKLMMRREGHLLPWSLALNPIAVSTLSAAPAYAAIFDLA